MNFAGVILAAGYSSRMGAFKPLLKLGNNSCLEHCISIFHQSFIPTVYVITGHNSSQIAVEAEKLGAVCVFNPEYDKGMFSSVCAAFSHVSNVDGIFVLPVDIPLVHSATIKLLAESFDGTSVLYPTHSNRRGHPPLIPACYVPQILQYDGNNGLKGALQNLPGENIDVIDQAVCMDMDNGKDYIRMKKFYLERSKR